MKWLIHIPIEIKSLLLPTQQIRNTTNKYDSKYNKYISRKNAYVKFSTYQILCEMFYITVWAIPGISSYSIEADLRDTRTCPRLEKCEKYSSFEHQTINLSVSDV